MSRIGRLPIAVPSGVDVTIDGRRLVVKGPKGELTRELHPDMGIDREDGNLVVSRPTEQKHHKQLHGLTRTLVNNMVVGVTTGYEKRLKIEGIGYQARNDKGAVVLTVGYSNPISLRPPAGVTFEVPDPTTIVVRGADKQKVGQFAAEIRAARKPEPYKGKGIRYENETVRRKEGKSFAGGG